MSGEPATVIEIFYSYAHEDEDLRNQLFKHLSSLRHEGLIVEWHDRQILPGTGWAYEIDSHLNTASIILLLVSPDFIESEYCYKIETARAMQRHEVGEAHVIPIILRPVDWKKTSFRALQVSPVDGKAITTWNNQDEAFEHVAKDVRKVIEKLNSSSRRRDTTRLPANPINYFKSLDNFLKSSGFRFPAQKDFDEDVVYLPEAYASLIKKSLDEKGRALLVGTSAVGKTVLAIALAKRLQETEGYTVNYKDACQAEEGDGRKWYRLVSTHDHKGLLYILDNCHLAMKEVNEFCSQLEENPPLHTQCILISRSDPGAFDALSDVSSYFEMWADATITIWSEDIYWGVLQKHAASYRKQNPGFYVPLEDDSEKMLRRQNANDLVIAKSRLEAWRNLGGKLSEVKKEAVYQALVKKYLSDDRKALLALCVLRQYEIRAHNSFVEEILPPGEVRQLQKKKLLTSELDKHYGVLYDLLCHPALAREIFEAYMYRRGNLLGRPQIEIGIADILRSYLKVKPANYVTVYESLARNKQKAILKQLLTQSDLQEYAIRQFGTKTIPDSIRYVYRLAKVDLYRARELLDIIVQTSGMQGICSKLEELTFQHIVLLIQSLQCIDAELANKILTTMDLKQLTRQVEEENLLNLFRLVQTVKRISAERANIFLMSIPLEALVAKATVHNVASMIEKLQKFEYQQLKTFVEMLDMGQLAQQSEKVSLQRLCWLLHALRSVSMVQARILLDNALARGLTTRATVSDFSSLEKIIRYMQEFMYPSAQIKDFVEALDTEQLAERVQKENLQRLYWLLRVLQNVSPSTANRLLETLTPAGLASLCRSKGATISIFGQLGKVSTRRFWQLFLQQFSAQEIADICNRSSLRSIGAILQYRYTFFGQAYCLFRRQFLEAKLKAATLEEVGQFIHHIRLVPEQGAELTRGVLGLLSSMDLSEHVASANLRQYALLLYHAKSVNGMYLPQLLIPVARPEILQAAVEKSDIGDLQRFIYNMAHIDKEHLRTIGEALKASNLTGKLESATLKDIGFFLWNVYAYIDQGLSQHYCKIVDMQQRPSQLAEAPLEDLCLFLWNMTSASGLSHLRTFDDPNIKERLITAWRLEPAFALALLGILSLAQPMANKYMLLPPIGQKHLMHSLADIKTPNPYIVALMLYGLKIYDERTAEATVHNYLPITEFSRMLKAARASAQTPKSMLLLEEVLRWLESFLMEREKRG